MSSPSLSVEQVKAELQRLRQGPSLAHPTTVLTLSEPVRAHLANGAAGASTEEVLQIVATLRSAIEALSERDRLYIEVDFNLITEHSAATLTYRQESLARHLKCAAKTVRRHANAALDTLAFVLVTRQEALLTPSTNGHALLPVEADLPRSESTDHAGWREELRQFWRLPVDAWVDIVCSEIPEPERPYFASPADRNYVRYAKFADLDTLIYLRTQLAQLAPAVTIRDFAPSEYYDTQATVVTVVGGPPWNAKYREFLPQLPFYFEPNRLGEDDPLVVPQLNHLVIGPRWTSRHELLEDLAVFTRLTLTQGTTVFLLGGCLTLGVLGAAHCFLQGERGAHSVRYVTDQIGGDDFVLITEARRIGGITDVADLTTVPPLVLLARRHNDPFSVIVDNTDRYTS